MNKAILTGILGRDPEIKTSQSGTKICSVTRATIERGFTKQDGTKVEDKTEWHRLVMFGTQAVLAERYLHKGDRIMVEGKIRTRQYTDRQGMQKSTTEIVVDEMEFLSHPRSAGQQAQPSQPQPKTISDLYDNAKAAQPSTPASPSPSAGGGSEGDDLPF